jgi:tRNA A-37 threonylcarbamoyl transferase component Bud32
MTNRSNTYIRSGVVQKRGSARNPWKGRPWIPKQNAPFDNAKVKRASEAKRPSFLQRDAVVRSLRTFGVPGANSYTSTYRASQGGTQLTTTASGSDLAKLTKLRGALTGAISIDALSKNARYTIQIQYPTFSGLREFRKAIAEVSRRMNMYARIRDHIPDASVPFYFSGLHPDMGAYVTVLGVPEETSALRAGDQGVSPIYHRLLDAGIYPGTASAVKKTKDGRYLISNPALFLEIPKGIHTAYRTYRAEEGPVEAWLSAGGAIWADTHSHFEFHKTGRVLRNAPITFKDTMNQHLALALDRVETGVASRRPVDTRVEQILGEITALSKKLGEGAYGQVFAVTLSTAARRKRMTTVQAALTNYLEFDSIKDKSRVVLKIEKLDPIRGLSKSEVRRLAGEAYTQQYVHTNSGIENPAARRREPVVTPGVYFSGTLANKYHLICMEYVDGVPLSRVTSRGFADDTVYQALVSAVETLIRNGVVHSDLHRNNVFVVNRGRSTGIQILDFGFASIVPPRMRVRMIETLERTRSIDAVYRTTGLIEAVNANKTGYHYYHSDAKLVSLLKWMRNRGPKVGVRSHPLTNDPSGTANLVGRAQRGLPKLRISKQSTSSRSVLRRGRSTPTTSSRSTGSTGLPSTRRVTSTSYKSARS